jgi:hypothetical protein
MRRILMIATVVLALGSAATPAGAATVKGGWATTTLDETVEPAPGETLDVGFTILQHGRTPVNVPDVVVIVHDGASDQRWPAVQEGAEGHYVAEVTFPDSGSYDWEVEQGYFGEFPLGTLHIGDEAVGNGAGSDSGADGSGWSQVSWPWRIALALPILASIALFFLDRRRRRPEADAPAPVTPASA